MNRITVSKYKNSKGETEYQAFYNWQPICKSSIEFNFINSYANVTYHQHQKAVLTHYDREKQVETIIEAKGYSKKEIKNFKLAQDQ